MQWLRSIIGSCRRALRTIIIERLSLNDCRTTNKQAFLLRNYHESPKTEVAILALVAALALLGVVAIMVSIAAIKLDHNETRTVQDQPSFIQDSIMHRSSVSLSAK